MMSFELKADESLPDGIRRIVKKELEQIREYMEGRTKDSRDDMVHESRKCLKKVRGVLRLVRPAIGRKTYRHENTALRDAAPPLTEVRDARIRVGTFDKIMTQGGRHAPGRSFTAMRKELVSHQRGVRRRVIEGEKAFAAVASAVDRSLDRPDDWVKVHNSWWSVGEGVERVYRRGRQALAAVRQKPTVEFLHEWRKQAKYLRYQLDLVRPLAPKPLTPLAKTIDRLGDLLGDDHDLAVLRREVAGDPAPFGGPEALEPLLARFDRRRQKLEHDAVTLERRVFRDPPQTFGRRPRGYWKTERD
jgi:CHAD domain-containing protein